MMHTRAHMTLTTTLALLMLLVSAPALAQSDEELRQADELPEIYQGSPVRNRILYRSTRLEASAVFGATLADSFKRNVLPGISANFFLTDNFSIGATAVFGVTHPNTDLKTNLEDQLIAAGNRQQDLDRLTFSYIKQIIEVEGSYVPLVGKFTLLNGAEVKFDVHLLFGVAFVGLGAEKAEGARSTQVDEALTGSQVSPTVGVGSRLFLTDNVALNLQVRNYIFQRAEISDNNVDTEWMNHPMVSLGVSIFFGEVKVSR